MTFNDAILQYYGINRTTAGVGGLSGSFDGLTVNINLMVPNSDIPAIAALMAQPAPAEEPASE